MEKISVIKKKKDNFVVRFFKDVGKTFLSLIRGILLYSIVGIALVVFFAFLGYGMGGEKEYDKNLYFGEKELISDSTNDKIAIVNMSGIISSNQQEDIWGEISNITPRKFENVFLQVKNDPNIKAVVFDINSGGGSPTASDRIYEQIVNFRRDTGIPVIFLFSDMAASGAYYIASAADFIVANPTTLTGSIGVIMESYNLEGLYEKIGVEKLTFTKGEYKDLLNDNREITEEERAILDKLSENTYQVFINRVAEGRGMSKEEVTELATGAIFSGTEAYELKLVDSLGNRDQAIYQAKRLASVERARVVEYTSKSVFGEFLTGISLKDNLLNNFVSWQDNLVRSRI